MRNSIQASRSGKKKVKKVKLSFLKPRHVSEVESRQQPNGAISFPVIGLQLSKIAFEGMTSSLGTMEKTKTSPLENITFVCISITNFIFGEFSNIYLSSTQNRVKWRHKIRPIEEKNPADFDLLCVRRRQIDARRGVPSFMSIQ